VFNFPNELKGRLEAPTGYVEIVDNQYLNDTKMTQKYHKKRVFRVIKKGN
jgi:hypothetical protein